MSLFIIKAQNQKGEYPVPLNVTINDHSLVLPAALGTRSLL